MPRQIIIQTGARLHFGLLANEPATGHNFGGAGLMIDSPGFRIAVQKSETDIVDAPEGYQQRVEKLIKMYRENTSSEIQHPACRIKVTQVVPPHRGLGSGTQLGMAVAKAISLLADEGKTDAPTLAKRVGRGIRSALGIHGFDQGGFLIDEGKTEIAEIGTLQTRLVFPETWRILLVAPPEKVGLSGEAELDAFAKLDPMPTSITEHLNQILQMEILPAVEGVLFDDFSVALFEFGKTVGEYFASAQGGLFADPRMAMLANHLQTVGVHGVGQTSWGPTLFAFCRDIDEAESLASKIAADARWSDCTFQVATPLNRGALIDVQST